MKARSCLLVAGALVLLLSVAPATSASSKSKLRTAVKAYSAAFLGGQAKKAWLMRTDHANEGITYAEFRAVCLQAHEIYGDAVMKSLTVDRLKGARALVSYTYDISDIDQARQPWRLSGGRWMYDYQSAKSSARAARQATTIVYIADTGTKYHRQTCRTLHHSKHKVALSGAKSHGYKPCKLCSPPR
jgi:hypothetical protein